MTRGLDGLLGELEGVVGPEHVLRGALTEGHVRDWTGRYIGATPAVVRPANTSEVASVLARCSQAGVAVVPQGGNTGLVGGGVPMDGELVLSLRRLDAVSQVDPLEERLIAGAGTTLIRLQQEAGRANRRFGVDLTSRLSATVGGMVATNAGGVHVMRFGDTRRQLCGIEAVLADGSVISHLSGLSKDNTGYDLASLVCGSEGTLAVVTAACLRVVPRGDERVAAMLGLDSVAHAVDAALALRTRHDDLEAVELLLGDTLDLVCQELGIAPPLPEAHPVYLLVECADQRDPTERFIRTLSRIGAAGTAIAQDRPRREALWSYREATADAINRLGPPHKLDVTVPLGRMGRFVEDVRDSILELAPAARCWFFGHLLDGNLHVNVTGLDPDDEEVDGAVLGLVSAAGGSISSEHGIGRAKRRWLHLNRSAEELKAFRAIKDALDPCGILNPNVLIP